MKTKTNIYKTRFFILVFFGVCSVVIAQNNSLINPEFIHQININNAHELLKNEVSENLLTDAQDVDLFINQIGSNNNLYIRKNSLSSQTIEQSGENNYFSFINYYNSQPSNFEVLQHGKSNSIQIYGENSIINNLQIIQKTNFKSIIIKNY